MVCVWGGGGAGGGESTVSPAVTLGETLEEIKRGNVCFNLFNYIYAMTTIIYYCSH